MAEHVYAYRLVVFGRTVYEGRIERANPKDALNWGLYWMPGDWTAGDGDAPVHAETAVMKEDGTRTSWRPYWTNYTREASYISRWDDEDVKCLLAGQDLVWQIVDRDLVPTCRRLFSSKRYAEDYMYHTMNRFDHVIPVWVDGWYDEQYSWKREEVKGYEKRMPLDTEED